MPHSNECMFNVVLTTYTLSIVWGLVQKMEHFNCNFKIMQFDCKLQIELFDHKLMLEHFDCNLTVRLAANWKSSTLNLQCVNFKRFGCNLKNMLTLLAIWIEHLFPTLIAIWIEHLFPIWDLKIEYLDCKWESCILFTIWENEHFGCNVKIVQQICKWKKNEWVDGNLKFEQVGCYIIL